MMSISSEETEQTPLRRARTDKHAKTWSTFMDTATFAISLGAVSSIFGSQIFSVFRSLAFSDGADANGPTGISVAIGFGVAGILIGAIIKMHRDGHALRGE